MLPRVKKTSVYCNTLYETPSGPQKPFLGLQMAVFIMPNTEDCKIIVH